ncbi:MAG: hypothetical protein ACK47R_20365, partial [Planctomycetia bacterium]
FQTCLKAANVKVPSDRVIDGGNLMDAFEKGRVERTRPLYWRCNIAPGMMKVAMRVDDWKIVANEAMTKFELYHLKSDPTEKEDLGQRESAKLAELTAAMKKLNAEIEAEGPTWWKNYAEGGEKKGKKKNSN